MDRTNKTVNVNFERDNGNTKGSFHISTSVARALAHSLIEASYGHYDENSKTITVRNNVALTEQAIAFNNTILHPIEDLLLSNETITALKKANIERLIDLITKTENELLEVPKLSAKGVKEIKVALERRDLSLDFQFDETE